MKKMIVVVMAAVIIIYAMSVFGCRERSVSPPGVEPTATVTPTVPPYFKYYLLDTPADVSLWTIDSGMTSSCVDIPLYSGTGCAKVSYNLTSSVDIATFRMDFAATNLTGRTISAHVYIPAALHAADYQMQVWFFTDAYAWRNSTYDLNSAGITPNAWNTLIFTPSGVGENSVVAIGLQLKKNGQPDASGFYYVDEVTVD